MKAAFVTLGCKVNSYDTQSILANLKQHGYEIAKADEVPDIFIVNTCAVTNESERKSRQMIRKMKNLNPNGIVVVTGCYPQTNLEEVKKMIEADIITGTNNRNQIPALINEYIKNKAKVSSIQTDDETEPIVTQFDEKTRATVKIQDGCRMFCTYCIIPYARNQIKCMHSDAVIDNIRKLCDKSYQEVVLTGIHLASYFSPNNERLIDLIERIDKETPLKRLRLGSLEPKLLTEDFLIRLKEIKCFCPHFHVSLQSGSDTILKAMNRRYTEAEYETIIGNIRNHFDEAEITTDIIVGFPGETDSLFAETLAFVKRIKFAHVHVFPYSPKKGTPAAEYEKQIPKALKHQRAAILIEETERIRDTLLLSKTGQVYEVLTESMTSDGYYVGFSRNYLKVSIKCKNCSLNTVYRVRISGCDNGILTADKEIDNP